MAKTVVYKPTASSKTTEIYPAQQKTQRTVVELMLLYGARIVASGNVGGANTTTLYTVPTNKVFLLVGAAGSFHCPAGTSAEGLLWTLTNNGATALLVFAGGASTVQTTVLNPAQPIRFNAGEKLGISGDTLSDNMAGAVVGYEIDLALLNAIA